VNDDAQAIRSQLETIRSLLSEIRYTLAILAGVLVMQALGRWWP
jgi:hypothetical protein